MLLLAGIACASAPPHPATPISKLKVATISGGEPVDVDLREDGAIHLRVAPAASGQLVARLVGSTVVALDGRVLAAWGKDGRLRAPGHSQTLHLRRCSLFDRPGDPRSDDGGEYGLDAHGNFWLKPPRGKSFSLPASATGNAKRDCATALILYWMVPILEDQITR